MSSGLEVVDYEHRDDEAPRRTGVLPEVARQIYTEISNAAEDATDLVGGAQDRNIGDKYEVYRIKTEIENYERQPNWSVHDRHYKQLQRELLLARKSKTNAQRRYDEKSETASNLVAIRSAIDTWLGAHYDVIILPHAHPAPKLSRGEYPAAAVTRVRQTIQEKRQERASVSGAPITAAEAKDAARAFVSRTAALARPDVSVLLAGSPDVYFPALGVGAMLPITMPDYGMVQAGGKLHDGLSLMCLLQGEAMVAMLEQEIDAAADDKRALPAGEKQARLEELDAAILAAERDEVAFITMAEEQGAIINHRRDVDPRALLRVAVAEGE